MKRLLCLIFVLCLILPIAAAKEGRLHLLAVKEGTKEGSTADLSLEIQPGKGRVFIETIPLSKFDTQISTRFAKDIACSYLEKDCTKYDFFYTLHAPSPIVGGPSAGAATAVLTVAVLEGIEINGDIVITGTINSGGIIGPVGGLKAKIEAASGLNIKTVLIPRGERFLKEDNLTLDLSDYAKKFNIAVVEVSDLTEVLFYFTEKMFKEDIPDIIINPAYQDTMESLATDLCNRTEKLQKLISEFTVFDRRVINKDFVQREKKALNLTEKGKEAIAKEVYYSAASYCFGANVQYRNLLLRLNEAPEFETVEEDIQEFEDWLSAVPIETITDLQVYMVVKERLNDASYSIEKAKAFYEEGKNYTTTFGYAIERVYSARSWSTFFGSGGKEFRLDKESLQQSCLNKISEAEERYQYALLYFPRTLERTEQGLENARSDQDQGDFELCLFKASKAKAEADVVLGAVGVAEDQLYFVLDSKLEAAKRVIAEQQEKDSFPILGYSYFEYARQLREDNPYSALLYSEYALELSNLDIYFAKKQLRLPVSFESKQLGLFVGGILLGAVVVFLIIRKPKKKKRIS